MVNLLIADNDFNYIKKLIHTINLNFDNVRIFEISTSNYETLKILNSSDDIDIVVLEIQSSFSNSKKIIDKFLLLWYYDYITNKIIGGIKKWKVKV